MTEFLFTFCYRGALNVDQESSTVYWTVYLASAFVCLERFSGFHESLCKKGL